MRITTIARLMSALSITAIATSAAAQPNVFLMVDMVQAGGPSAVQSSVAYSRNKGASYSDTSMSASASKSASASSDKESSGYAYKASAAAAASNGRSSAAARASASGSGGSSSKSSSVSSQSSASAAKANVQYEQTGGDDGLPASEALSTLASSLLQYEVDVTYPEMLLAEFFNGRQPSFDFLRKSPKYGQILTSLADQQVGFVLAAKLSIRGTGGTVSNYGCQGSLTAALSKTQGGSSATSYSTTGSAKGRNLEDCQRMLTTQLSDALAEKIRPALGD